MNFRLINNRLVSIGVFANGDVRLCNCRYDKTIETEEDSLFIANVVSLKWMVL